MIEDEGMDFSNIRETLLRLLPVLLIGTMLVANAMVIATQVLPQWQLYADVQQNLSNVEAQIAAASRGQNDDESILQQQVDEADDALAAAARPLLTPSQPEEVLANLYWYAGESGVTITGVLTQQSALDIESDLYNVRMFRLHVLGSVPRLMNFVMRLEEARIPSVQIANLSISQNEETSDLTMDVLLYNSAHATGAILDSLPQMAVPAPFDPPPPAAMGAEAALEAAPPDGAPQADLPPDDSTANVDGASPDAANADTTNADAAPAGATASDADRATDPETAAAAASPGTQAANCDAPPTTFQIGDTVVVDFNTESVLNILDRPRTSSDPIELIGAARDNEVLQILNGPVCGQWRGADVWYWQIDHNGVQGWVGEASAADRWLCPQDEPECT